MLSPEPLGTVWQKRVFDAVVGAFLLILAVPLFIFFGALLLLEHILRGRPFDPLFYKEPRLSRGRLFNLYKFNIFDQRALEHLKKNGAFVHTKRLEWDGQLMVVGRVLRQIYLDELPQLFNVLRGEMSLVGPRPVNLEVYTRMCEKSVPPIALILGGMSGNYQSHKNTRGLTAAELEARYLEMYKRGGWRLVYEDIKIIVRTVKVLVRAQGV